MKLKNKANSPVFAVNCLLQGLKLFFRSELRKYILIPIFINLVLYSIAFSIGYYYIADLIGQFIPSWLTWLEWIIWPLFYFSFSIICFFTFTLIANLLAAPFYSQLAAKTLDVISGKKNNIKEQVVTQVIWAELKRIVYIVSRMLPLLVLFIIPVINLLAPFLWVLFVAWGMGLEYMAYPAENQGQLFSEQKNNAKTRRIGVLCFGGLVMIGLTIPLLNLIVAPVAVIAATVYSYELSVEG